MRVAILCSSPYSETGCAVTARLAKLGYVPVGALTLPSWDRGTLSRSLDNGVCTIRSIMPLPN